MISTSENQKLLVEAIKSGSIVKVQQVIQNRPITIYSSLDVSFSLMFHFVFVSIHANRVLLTTGRNGEYY